MQICATLVCNTKNSDEQSIICVNYVLSGSQYSSVVMASEQVGHQVEDHDDDDDNDENDDDDDDDDHVGDHIDDNFNGQQVDQPHIQIKSDQSDEEQGGSHTRNGSPESLKGSLVHQHCDADDDQSVGAGNGSPKSDKV